MHSGPVSTLSSRYARGKGQFQFAYPAIYLRQRIAIHKNRLGVVLRAVDEAFVAGVIAIRTGGSGSPEWLRRFGRGGVCADTYVLELTC